MDLNRLIYAVLGGLILTLISLFLLAPLLRRLNARQEILKYVTLHEKKKGTPTMGGIAFVLVFVVLGLLSIRGSGYLAVVAITITAAYAILGFLDDFIKIKFRRNLGLTSGQKAFFQLVIAIIAAIIAYTDQNIGGILYIPFVKEEIDVGAFIIPIVILAFLGFTNGVNLTDGIDGLASTVSSIVFAVACCLVMLDASQYDLAGRIDAMEEMSNLAVLCAIMVGAVISFLVFNVNPAKLFMGDTGSMALGALMACIAVFSKNTISLILPGVMFVVSALTVIIQVVVFKIKKKRVFLMAPYHHHMQMKGHSEPRICAIYALVTVCASCVLLWGVL